MADMKATVTANVDCTALIQADLAALLFELVGDLRERCKSLENTNAAIDAMHLDAVRKRDQLGQELDDCHVEISVRSLERQELQRELADAKVQVVNERNEFREQLSQVTAERDAARKQVAELTKKAGELPAEREWAVDDWLLSANTGSVWTVKEKTPHNITLQRDENLIHSTVDALKKNGFQRIDRNDSTGTDGEGQP